MVAKPLPGLVRLERRMLERRYRRWCWCWCSARVSWGSRLRLSGRRRDGSVAELVSGRDFL